MVFALSKVFEVYVMLDMCYLFMILTLQKVS